MVAVWFCVARFGLIAMNDDDECLAGGMLSTSLSPKLEPERIRPCPDSRPLALQSINRQSRMLSYLNYKMRVTIADQRHLVRRSARVCSSLSASEGATEPLIVPFLQVGRFMSFDRHMNIVLGDCEEYRKIPAKKGKGGANQHKILL